ncbi:MAG: HlyD family type I secretion periplasmic adaptor subunit [Methylococcaceae bacterium]|nr:MAG: HlyD family type I secretion periplasmic adaptor subunit [Methylococcaceae bacterium]
MNIPNQPQNTPKPRAVPLGERQRHLLSETVHIEEELIPRFVRPMLGMMALVVMLFFVWASLTQITEVARAPAEIIPSGKAKVVQHLDGGVVQQILVEEHALVQEGQELLRIDGSQATADLRQMESRLISLRLRAERLAAVCEDRRPKLAPLAGSHADLLADQEAIYHNQLATRESSLAILDRQIDQHQRRLIQDENALASAKRQQALTGELISMREDLAARHLINRTVLLETRRAKVTADGEVMRIKEDIDVARQELAEFKNRRLNAVNQFHSDALNELGTVNAEIAEAEESLQHLKAKVERLIVRAPHRGLVQELAVHTIGQVVQPGALLMQIVPDDVPLEAEVRIQPKDIGYVRVDQKVNMRVTSYDYSRYGFAAGTLKRISATSSMDEANKPFFKGWVTLQSPYVGTTPGQNLLQPGMGGEAEIITGQKSLLTYLSKPVIDVMTRSFHER